MHFDYFLFPIHTAFWCSFGITRLLTRHKGSNVREESVEKAVLDEKRTAPFSKSLLVVHFFAFGAMYRGMALAIMLRGVPQWFSGQRLVGILVIAVGAALVSWAVAHFNSWRFRAELDRGHELATGGPFRIMRHPIYMGLNLLALGTAIWIPSTLLWVSVILMVLGSDLRARAEEKILLASFGPQYRDYFAHTRRFLPGIY